MDQRVVERPPPLTLKAADAPGPSHSRVESGHLLQGSTSLIKVLPNEIDVEEEARLYEALCDVRSGCTSTMPRGSDDP